MDNKVNEELEVIRNEISHECLTPYSKYFLDRINADSRNTLTSEQIATNWLEWDLSKSYRG